MEKFMFSLLVMVLGMIVVFVGLVILIFAIKLLSAILASFNKPKTPEGGEKKAITPAPAPVAAPVSTQIQAMAAPAAQDDTQLAAVIAAAILMMQEAGKKLVVRSIRRVGTRSEWSAAGRREQLG